MSHCLNQLSSIDLSFFSKGSYKRDLALLLAIPAAKLTMNAMQHIYENGIGVTTSNLLGRVLVQVPSVKNKYDQKIAKQFSDFQNSVNTKWNAFGDPITVFPDQGMSLDELIGLIERYAFITLQKVKNKQFSGAIYSSSFHQDEPRLITSNQLAELKFPENLAKKDAMELKTLFIAAYEYFYLINPLHGDEFGIGQFINYQLIQILGSHFGGKSEEIAGFVTSGGTESLMTASLGYTKWGREEKNLSAEECVIIAPDSIHAALDKAQSVYRFKLVKVPTDENGHMLLNEFQKITNQYKTSIVALFGSAPSYSKGKVDPIEEMAKVACKLGCGFHVDCCLGGLVIDMIENQKANFLEIPGVTSLSVDPHKNGMAPKGCSVLVTKKMPIGKNLAFYPIYAIPNWSGGIYGTPTTAGSSSSVPAFASLLALLKMGKKGYQRAARSIHETAVCLGVVIQECEGLKLLGQVEVNVVAFSIDKKMGYEKGAIYGFTSLMKDNGFVCSNISSDAAHFCVTGRFAGETDVIKRFQEAAEKSIEDLKKLNQKKLTEGTEFPGEASLYGEIGAALNPKTNEMSFSKYAENSLFGEQGSKDAIRSYFLAHSNPKLKG